MKADDGVARCPWGLAPPEYRRYHDTEWGRPVADEVRVFEKLCLEGFQSGLSWLTVLRKREAFRAAFRGFDPAVVAGYTEADVARLLSDSSIIRHRGKVEAVIANAQAVLALREEGLSLAAVLWSHEPPGTPVPHRVGELPAATPESRALSALLRRRGFRFVGPTTVYAAMEALGVVNDHLDGCALRRGAQAERERFSVPGRGACPPGPGHLR